MVDTSKTKARLIAELEELRAKVRVLEEEQGAPGQGIAYLRSVVESAPLGIGIYRQGITLYVNQAYVRMTGYSSSGELIGKSLMDVAAPRFREELLERSRLRELGEDVPASYEVMAVRKDGTEFPVHVQAAHIDLPDGPAVVGFFTDITDRKQTEEIAHQAEKRHRDIYENAIEGMFQSTPQGIFLSVNPAMAHIYGYDLPGEMCAAVTDIASQIYADPQARIEFARMLSENGKIEDFEARGRRRDGSIIWISCNAWVVKNEDGAIVYYEGTLEDITKRKQAEEQLVLLKLSIDATSDGVYWMDTEGRFSYANEAGCKALGYSQDEMLQLRVFDVNPRVTPQRWAELWKVLREEGTFVTESIHRRKDGSLFPVEINSTYVQFEGQEYCNGFAHDVTERKRVREALMASEERYRTLAEASHDMIFIISEKGTVEYVNRFAADQLGIQPEAVVGKSMGDIFPGQYGKRQRANINKTLATNAPLYVEAPIMFSGGERWVGTWLVPLEDKAGQASVMGVARDFTERKQAADELFTSRQMIRTVLDNIPQRVFWKDRNSVFVGCNKSFALDCGYNDPGELVGKTSRQTASAAFVDLYHADDRQVMETGQAKLNYEEPQIRPDGNQAWLITSKIPLHDTEGRVIGVLGTYEDITERKRAEEALQEKTEELDRFFSLAIDLLCIANIDGYFIRLNASWENTLGYKLEDLEGKRFLDLVHPDDLASTLSAVAALSAGQQVLNFVNRYQCKDGSYRWIEWRSVPYQNRLIYAGARDITERKKVEETLRESEERARIISELTTDYAFIVDVDSQGTLKLRWASDTMARVTGRAMSDVQTMDTWKNLIVPEDQDQFFQFIQQTISSRQLGEIECRSFRGTGVVHWLHIITYPQAGEDGGLVIVGAVKDITERKRAEEALRESEEKFRHIVEASPMGMHMYRLGPDNRLVFIGANPAADRILGVENAQFIGKTIEEAFPALVETEAPERYRLAAAKGEIWHTDQITYEEGQISGAFDVYAFQTSPGFMAAMFLDVTDRKQTEAALKQYTTRLETLHDIDQAILLAETPQAIAEAALGHLRDLIPCQRASVSIFDFEQDEVEILASQVSGKTQVGTGLKMPVRKYGIDEEILHGQIMLINDLIELPHPSDLRRTLLDEGIRSIINVPLVVQGEPIGSLNLGAARPASFTHERVEIAREVADQLAITIQHARLRERDQHHTEELEERVAERTAELRAAYEQLQALSRVKDDFVSNVSHELRTPIASAKTYLHLLDKRPDKEEQYIETLKREVTRLEHLIEGLLTLSRLDQNRVSKNLATIDMNALIDEYITDRTPLAENKNLHLVFTPSTEASTIIGDRQLIGEVFSILLTNAFNYTSAGGQVVISTHTEELAGKLWTGFSITDTGWGIAPEELPFLFERFYRGKAAHETNVSGTGLGLSIAKEIIDLHLGRIEIHSDGIPGHGTRFNVWLPAELSS